MVRTYARAYVLNVEKKKNFLFPGSIFIIKSG